MKMIKNLSYAVAIAIMALGFTACTQNEDITPTLKGQEINATFSVGGVQTRVNTLGTGDSWENKDELKVKIFTDYDPGSTAVLSFNSATNEWSRSGSFRWLDESDSHTILAVYPPDTDFENYNIQYDLHEDQSSEVKLKNADLITGYWRDVPRLNLSIPMTHRMSMVTVTYEVGTADYPDMDISGLQVCSKYANVTFSVDKTNGLVMSKPATTTSTWVTAYKHDTKKFSAIVVPGSYTAGEVFLKLTSSDQKNFNVRMDTATEFQEGYRYEYKVKVGENKVELTQINANALNGWTDENDLN